MTIKCSINITETRDGKLLITANIPDNAQNSVAGELAKALINQSSNIMNQVLGENKTPERFTAQ